MTSVLLWPDTLLRTHKRQRSSDRRSAMQMNLDPKPPTINPALSHRRSDRLGCNIHGGVYSALIYTWGRIFSTISRFCHRSMRLAIFALESSARSAILSEVLADCCPSCDWLQQSRTPHKTMIGPVMDFPHASPAVTQHSSNALLRVFELAHGVNFTKSMSICSDVACGCGYRVYLWRP